MRAIRCVCILMCLLLGSVSQLEAQPLRFSHISAEQGLTSRYCWFGFQDRYGFVWVGTQAGLNRWDGVSMKRYIQNGDTTQLRGSNCLDYLEAKDGTLWFAMLDGGLCRYNRRTESFSSFIPPSSGADANESKIYRIYEGSDSKLWLGVLGSGALVYCFDPSSQTFTQFNGAKKDAFNTVLTFCEVKNSGVYLGTDAGLFRVDASSKSIVAVGDNAANPAEPGKVPVTSLRTLDDGHLMVATIGRGLYVLDNPASGHFVHWQSDPSQPQSLPHNDVLALHHAANGSWWALCTSGGPDGALSLCELSLASLGSGSQALCRRVDVPQSPGPSFEMNSVITESPTGELWVNGIKGAFSYDPQSARFTSYEPNADDALSLSGGLIRRIFFDASGGTWIVSRNDGLNYGFHSVSRFSALRTNSVLPQSQRLLSQRVSRMIQDSHGNMWFGYYLSTGVSKYDPKSGSFEHYEHRDGDESTITSTPDRGVSVNAIYEDRDGSILFGTFGGLCRLNPQTKKFTNFRANPDDPHSLKSNTIESIIRDKKGVLWISTRRGLHQMDSESGSFSRVTVNPGNKVVEDPDYRASYQDASGVLWFGGTGVHVFDPANGQWRSVSVNISDTNALVSGFVCGFAEGPGDQMFAVDSRGAFCSISKSSLRVSRLSSKLGLPYDLSGIVRTQAGVMWMLSEGSGLWSFNPVDMVVHHFNTNDGLPNNSMFDRAISCTRDGFVWAGTLSGPVSFHPDNLSLNQVKPKVIISGVRGFNGPIVTDSYVADAKRIDIAHDETSVTFEFVAFNFLHADKNRYKYRLEGFDPDWIECGPVHEAKYTSLPPGTYRFHVIASNNDDVWNEEGASIEVVVHAPWWATIWARAIMVVLLIGGGFGTFRWRTRRMQMRNQILEREVSERTRDLSKAKDEIQVQAEQVTKKAHDLEKALTELQQTQSELVQSEKMAALGQLVAGIAHEVNTPLGAIKAAIGNIRHATDEVMQTLPSVMRSLNDAELQLLLDLVKRSVASASAPTGREARNARRAMAQSLSEAGIEQADHIAEMMIEMGLTTSDDAYLNLWKRPDARGLIDAAYNMALQSRQSATIEVAVERASKVVFALKTYAHYDHRNEKQLVSVANTIEVVMTLYHNTLKHGIEVSRDFDPTVPDIMAYGDELTQVWTNLVHNAIQAMGGKGTMTVGVGLRTDKGQRQIEVRVGDTGGGIPEEIRDRIFSPFFTTKPAGEGSGLGLDICRKIVEKHGGSISFDSTVGVGTTFFVRLPLSEN